MSEPYERTSDVVVSVIIVSFNTRELLRDCVSCVLKCTGSSLVEIIVVDNASNDGSVEMLRAEFPIVQVIPMSDNLGFGRANNVGIEHAKGEFLLFLNSDAFVTPSALANLTAYMRNNSEVGVVGPRLLNKDGSLQPSCFRFPSPTYAWLENLWISSRLPDKSGFSDFRNWSHDRERVVDWVSGACFLVRREVIGQVGAFDETYFMYQEETDWQRRIRSAGWEIAFSPTALVTHLGGASGSDQRAKIKKIFFESLDTYTRKHHGMLGLISLRLAMIVGCILRLIAWSLVVLAVPQRRQIAISKVQLSLWLICRQTLCWSVRTAGKVDK